MIKILNISFWLFFTQILFSQNFNNIQIEYITKIQKVDVDKELKNKNVPNHIKTMIEERINEATPIHFILKYSKGKSIFQVKDENLKSDIKKSNLMSVLSGSKSIMYYNLSKDNLLSYKEAYGNDFIIKLEHIKWTITNESKKIGKYLVIKAICSLEVHTLERNFKKNIEAWFAPKLPLPIGPNRFVGLPGIVLELKNDKLTYFATNIVFNEVDDIKPPKINRKIISEKDFNKISIRMAEKRKEKISKIRH